MIVFAAAADPGGVTRETTWDDIALPLQPLLIKHGISRAGFSAYVAGLRKRNQIRVREGDLDHLVYYMLQSSTFTRLPVIEPAQSAAEFVGRFSPGDRTRFLSGGQLPGGQTSTAIPDSVKARIEAFAGAVEGRDSSVRLAYFRDLLAHEHAGRESLRTFLSAQYARAMRFLYEKEFPRGDRAAPETGALYQQRGLSTDTSADAGFVVYLALGALRQLEPDRRIERALIIGPGLDLAPRTGLVETGAPQSYQPFAVMDALLATGLAVPATLRLTAADINPRVVTWLRGIRGTSPHLMLHSGIFETDRIRLTEDYRTYFTSLGKNVGVLKPMRAGASAAPIAKSLEVSSSVTSAVDATLADITVDRLDQRYDLIVVTNVFPYLSDSELLLALANVVQMLNPGGILIHNEARPLLAEATLALHLPLIHSRSAVVATVERGASPLYDSAWMHKASAY